MVINAIVIIGMICAAAFWHALTPWMVTTAQAGVIDPDKASEVRQRTIRRARVTLWLACFAAMFIVLFWLR